MITDAPSPATLLSADEALHRMHAATAPAPIAFDQHGWASGDGASAARPPWSAGQLPTGYAQETPKQQALAPGLVHIEGVVWHYTDTRGCGAENLALRLLDPSNKRAASWHACIDATGAIVQSVSAKCGSWHAGGAGAKVFARESDGEWTPLTPAQRGQVRGWDANAWAFGIELENAGELRLVDGRWCSWPFAFGTKYGAPIVVPVTEVAIDKPGHGWHAFTAAQVDAATRLLAGLAGAYGLRRSACGWTHAFIDPANRVDPGPVWETQHLPGILDAVFGTG